MNDKKFLLRLDQQLYDQVVEQATAQNRSVNNYIVHLLEKTTKDQTFENRQFVGQSIAGSEILPESGLVSVHGIYYRYFIAIAKSVNSKKMYTIIEANGNILTLEELS